MTMASELNGRSQNAGSHRRMPTHGQQLPNVTKAAANWRCRAAGLQYARVVVHGWSGRGPFYGGTLRDY